MKKKFIFAGVIICALVLVPFLSTIDRNWDLSTLNWDLVSYYAPWLFGRGGR